MPTPQSVRVQSPRLKAPACTSSRLSTFSCPRTCARRRPPVSYRCAHGVRAIRRAFEGGVSRGRRGCDVDSHRPSSILDPATPSQQSCSRPPLLLGPRNRQFPRRPCRIEPRIEPPPNQQLLILEDLTLETVFAVIPQLKEVPVRLCVVISFMK